MEIIKRTDGIEAVGSFGLPRIAYEAMIHGTPSELGCSIEKDRDATNAGCQI